MNMQNIAVIGAGRMGRPMVDRLAAAGYRPVVHARRPETRAAAEAGPRPRRRVANVTIHETTDPEVIVAEFEYQGTDPVSGAPYALPAIFVLRVRDGEIVSSRDYHDHLASARAAGRLGDLFAALSAQGAAPAPADEAP